MLRKQVSSWQICSNCEWRSLEWRNNAMHTGPVSQHLRHRLGLAKKTSIGHQELWRRRAKYRCDERTFKFKPQPSPWEPTRGIEIEQLQIKACLTPPVSRSAYILFQAHTIYQSSLLPSPAATWPWPWHCRDRGPSPTNASAGHSDNFWKRGNRAKGQPVQVPLRLISTDGSEYHRCSLSMDWKRPPHAHSVHVTSSAIFVPPTLSAGASERASDWPSI